jgi:hypothetical protein
VPLHRSYNIDDDGRERRKRREKIRMDPRTQGTLTAIHGLLMENDRVKGRFMTTTSQLVNDKKYKRERVAMMMEGRSGLGEYVGDDDRHC